MKLQWTCQLSEQMRSQRRTQPLTQVHWAVKRRAASFLVNSTKLPLMVQLMTVCNLHTRHTAEAWNFYYIIILEPQTSEQPTAADTQLPDERSKRHEERKKRVNVYLFTAQCRGDIPLYFISHVFHSHS